MLYSGQKSAEANDCNAVQRAEVGDRQKTHEAHGEVLQPRGPGAAEPLGRWAAGPLGRYRPFASKEMSGPAECAERLNKLEPLRQSLIGE